MSRDDRTEGRTPPEPQHEPDGSPVPRRTSADRTWQWLFIGSLVALVAVIGFGGGMVAERVLFSGGDLFERARELGSLTTDRAPEVADAYPRFAETRALLEDEYFYRPTDPEAVATFAAELERGAVAGMAAAAATPVATLDEFQRQLDYGAARGMTTALEDDYTVFLEPIEQAPLSEALEGEYEGIGVWVEHPEGRFTIVTPIPGSPAEEAGLRSGDVILAADGVELTGMVGDQALDLIRGPAGTSVTLTIERPGTPGPFDVKVERQSIALPSVVYEPVADGRVAHIAIGIFGDNTTAQLDQALRRAQEEGVAGIVLDLRGNGGGWVTSARETVGRFVPESRGPALYEDRSPEEGNELTSESIVGGGEEVFDLPLAVLVDGSSASSAEIVAGALRDYGRATLVGEATFGKGSVQRVHDFDDGSSARITFARWLTPNKLPIPDEGLAPDVVVTAEDPAAAAEAQLRSAVDRVLAAAGEEPAVWATPLAGATPQAATPVAGATPVADASPVPGATPGPGAGE